MILGVAPSYRRANTPSVNQGGHPGSHERNPELDKAGLHAVPTLADEAIAAGVKALVLTGHGLKLKPGSLAPYQYLLKPIRIAELTAAIDQ